MNKDNLQNILAVDTSSNKLVLGLAFGGDRVVKSEEAVEQSHGQVIIKKIGELINSAAIEKEDLDAVVVCVGPGSFTGLRIGLAASKGIATALNIDVAAVNLFEIAAYKLKNSENQVGVLVPLKKDEFFLLKVGADIKIDTDNIEIISDKELKEIVDQPLAAYHFELGEYMKPNHSLDFSGSIEYDAADIIEIGKQKLSQNMTEDLAALEPLYVQKSQAELNYDRRFKK